MVGAGVVGTGVVGAGVVGAEVVGAGVASTVEFHRSTYHATRSEKAIREQVSFGRVCGIGWLHVTPYPLPIPAKTRWCGREEEAPKQK